MSKKSNVHPGYYKTAGRDRQDDAAAGRLARAIAAKPASQQHPDRMTKGLYFERPEPTRPAAAGATEDRAQKENASRPKMAKKTGARKASAASAGASAVRAQKETPSRAKAAKKTGVRKASPRRRTTAPGKAASARRTTGRPAKPGTKRKKPGV